MGEFEELKEFFNTVYPWIKSRGTGGTSDKDYERIRIELEELAKKFGKGIGYDDEFDSIRKVMQELRGKYGNAFGFYVMLLTGTDIIYEMLKDKNHV